MTECALGECILQKLKENASGEGQETTSYENVVTRPPLFTTLRLNTNQAKTAESIIEELKQEIAKNCRQKKCVPFSVVQHPVLPDVAVVCGRGPCHRQMNCRQKKCVPFSVVQHPVLPDVAVVCGRGPCHRQMSEKEVIVDHWCGSAVLRGADVFAQGIKAAPASLQRGDTVSVYADLEGKCKKGLLKPYTGHKLYVGNGTARFSRQQLFVHDQKPSGVGIEMSAPLYEAPSLSGFLPALLFPQNLPSAVVGHVLAPGCGERVLDMCAAPGGKTTHIATLMQNTGEVFALDKTDGKVRKIIENARNWNLTNIKAFAFDATKALDTSTEFKGRPPFPAECFDRVLLDGPCSALGQRPMLVNQMTVKELQSYPCLQKALLTAAVGVLKRGGTLVYSTCTLTTEENEEMVAWALKKFPTLQLSAQEPHLGCFGRKVEDLTFEECRKLQRFNPYAEQDRHSADTQKCNSLTSTPDGAKEICVDTDTLNDSYQTNSSTGLNSSLDLTSGDSALCTSTEGSGDAIDAVNSDTIGFFIAKFVKR